jgi:adenylylsulfate kinase
VRRDSLAAVLWFTGLSGAGKSTLAAAVEDQLIVRDVRTELLDGDAVRILSPTGFTRADRDAHVKRVGFLASRLEHHGVTVLCALISPYAEARSHVRALCQRFVEIHVATPLQECERRDVKGLYARARKGELSRFTGIDDAYEPPEAPDLVVDTTRITVEEAACRVLSLWEQVAGAALPPGVTRRSINETAGGINRHSQAPGHDRASDRVQPTDSDSDRRPDTSIVVDNARR